MNFARKNFLLLLLPAIFFIVLPSCKSGKIACPAYAGIAPKKKAGDKGGSEIVMPKSKKPKSGVLPPGFGKKH